MGIPITSYSAIIQVKELQSVSLQFNMASFLTPGLPLTWKAWESHGIWQRPLKVREFVTEFQKLGKSQGILLSKIHFQPS